VEQAMEEVHKLRAQIGSIVQSNFPEAKAPLSPNLPPPNNKQVCAHGCINFAHALNTSLRLQLKILRQLLTAGFIDHVAVRKDLLSKNPEGSKYSSSRGIPYCALNVEEDVFIHPSSVLFHSPPPDYVVYQDIVRSNRVWMKSTSTTAQLLRALAFITS
jgi:ATP-dependent RNA helicase DHX37/DHR1